ncbi:hypothetical protein BJV77DRAFT_1069963 [Russula vinacea]|nr:hypothetical protein BJV77DRAFT_1069963 [Russula vinacea]
MIITLATLPLNTHKANIRPIFQRFGEVKRISVHPGGRPADIVFADVHCVKRHILMPSSPSPGTTIGGIGAVWKVRPADHAGSIRSEHTENRPYGLSSGSLGDPPGAWEPLDSTTSRATVNELKRTVLRWRSSRLSNFRSRPGRVVEVTSNRFAHVEFASAEEALRAARQGAPYGFRYAERLLGVDFAHWMFYIGPAYPVSGWYASDGRYTLSQWTYDIPNIVG